MLLRNYCVVHFLLAILKAERMMNSSEQRIWARYTCNFKDSWIIILMYCQIAESDPNEVNSEQETPERDYLFKPYVCHGMCTCMHV